MTMQRINISIPDELARELKRAIPARSRSRYITQTIREKLKKSDQTTQLKKSAEAQKSIIAQIQEDFKYVDADEFIKIP